MGNGASSIARSNSYTPYQSQSPEFEAAASLIHSNKINSNKTTSTSASSLSDHNAPKITIELVSICDSSWKLISKSTATGVSSKDPHKIAGFGQFCLVFFDCMLAYDVDHDVLEKFEPRSSSALISREALLYRVIKYLVSVPSDSFKVKAKLRALGRAHAYRGIVQRHFEVFSASMIRALELQLKAAATNEVMRAWTTLLNFVVEQLAFDKVVLVPHNTLSPLPSSTGLDPPGPSLDTNKSSDVDSMMTHEPIATFTRLNSFGSSTDQSSRDASFNFLADAAATNPDIVLANHMTPIPENVKEKESSTSSGNSKIVNASSHEIDEDSDSAEVGASDVSVSLNGGSSNSFENLTEYSKIKFMPSLVGSHSDSE